MVGEEGVLETNKQKFRFEAKQPKQTVSKQTETTLNFLKKIPKYALYQTVSVALLFVSVQSKHRLSDSAETSFSSSLVCFELNLVLKDTLWGKSRGSLLLF